jgi:hypothetical protein
MVKFRRDYLDRAIRSIGFTDLQEPKLAQSISALNKDHVACIRG